MNKELYVSFRILLMYESFAYFHSIQFFTCKKNEPGALLRTIIDLKYGVRWCSNEVNGSHGVGLWKYIRRGWATYSSTIRFEVGDGS